MKDNPEDIMLTLKYGSMMNAYDTWLEEDGGVDSSAFSHGQWLALLEYGRLQGN